MMAGYLPQRYGKDYPDTLVGVDDVAPLVRLLESLPKRTAIAVDTETTGLHPYEHDVIRGVSIAFRDEGAVDPETDVYELGALHSFYIPVNYPSSLDNLAKPDIQRIFHALIELEPFLVLHHGKFDFTFLRQLPTDRDSSVFFSFPNPEDWWDTQVVAWLLDENLPTGLKAQAALHWGEDEKEEQKAIKALVKVKGWDGLTPGDTAQYGAKDAEQTLRLYELQLPLVDGSPSILGVVRPALERELAVQGALYRMHRTGILVNAERIAVMRDEAAVIIGDIEQWFLDIDYGHANAGGIDTDLYTIPAKGVNINSPRQLAAYLYDGLGYECKATTPTGARGVNRAALEELPQSPQVEKLLQHRRLKKAQTGYLIPLLERLGHDGRVHPSFSSNRTVTGRFSCSDPNLQTIPRGDTLKGVRDVFIAEPGCELWEYDLQSAEKRVMAGMSGEQVLIDALNEGTDVHGALALLVFGADYSGIQRRYAKNVGYGFDYGLSSPKTAAKYIGGPDAVTIAVEILAGLKKMYPNIVRLMRSTTRKFEKDGYLRIHETAWPGRYRRLITPAKIKPAAFTGLNAQIQGGIGELMKDVMLQAEEPVAALGGRICLQVHDSLVIELPEGAGEAVGAALQLVLDKCSPFAMPMFFEGNPWGDHD